MANIIDEAVVRILPDFSQFRSSLRTQLSQYRSNPAVVKVKLTADDTVAGVRGLTSSINKVAREAEKNANAAKIKVQLDTRQVQAQLNRLARDRTMTINVRYNTVGGGPPAPPLPPRPGPGGGGNGNGGAGVLSSLGGGIGGNAVQGAAIAGLATLITPIAATLTGLTSTLAVATAGVGAFGVAATAAFANAKQEIDRFNQGLVTFDQLPADLQRLIPQLDQFKASYSAFVASVRGPVFDVAIQGMQLIEQQMPRLAPIVQTIGRSFQGVLADIGQAANGPEMSRFLQTIQTQAPQAINSLTRTALNLGDGLLSIFSDFAPAGQSILDTIEQLTGRFREWATSLQGSEAGKAIFDYIQENGPRVVDLIGQLVTFSGRLIEGLAPVGEAALHAAQGFTAVLNAIPVPVLTVITGLLSVVLVKFLALFAIRPLVPIGRAIAASWTAMGTSFALGGSAAQIASVGVRVLAASLRGLIISTGIGIALVGLGYAFEALTSGTDEGTKATDTFTVSQNELAAALQKSNGLLNDQAKLAAFNDLKNAGLFESGAAVGIQPGQLTPAYAGGNLNPLIEQQQGRLNRLSEITEDNGQTVYNRGESQDVYYARVREAQALREARPDIEKFINTAKTLQGEFDQGKISEAQYAEGMKAIGLNAEGAAGGVSTITEALQRMTAQTDVQQVAGHVTDIKNQWQSLQRGISDAKQRLSDVDEQNAASAKSAKEQITSSLDAVVKANRHYRDSLDAIKDAQDRVKESQKALTEAREQARREIRDSYDEEESLALQKIRLDQEVLRTSGLAADDPRRRQALLDQKNINEQISDTTKDNSPLRKGGVEGSPQVVSAKQRVANDEKGLRDAYENSVDALKDVKTANDNVAKAHANYTKVVRDGKRAHQDALQNLRDKKIAADEYFSSLSALDRPFVASLKVDGEGTVVNALNQIRTYIEAIRISSEDSTKLPDDVWREAQGNVTASGLVLPTNARTSPNIINGQYVSGGGTTIPARGGAIFGPGTSTSDSIPAMLSNNEHVWTSAEVQAAGGHGAVAALRSAVVGKTVQDVAPKRYASGGAVRWNGPTVNLGKSTYADVLLRNLSIASAPADGSVGAGEAVSGGGPGSIAEIIAAMGTAPKNIKVDGAGNRFTDNEGFMGKPHGGMTNHGKHMAVDFNYGGDLAMEHAIAMWWMNSYGSKLKELIHTDSGPPYVGQYIKDGKIVGPYAAADHKDHVHVAAAPGFSSGAVGLVGAGGLAGYTGGVAGLKDYFLGGGSTAGGAASGSASVRQTAEATARAMGATPKQLLSLMEAGYVESEMRNLNYGADDSLGFLQQRPSQGWKNPMNVATATRSFINKAKRVDKAGYDAGELAQAVQVSAYPDKYGKRRADAYAALNAEAPTIPAGIFDTGGILKPKSAAINASNEDEYVFNKRQMRGLGGMSPAEKRELATMIAQAVSTRPEQWHMDGKVVGEKAVEDVSDILGFNSPGGV